MPNIYLQVMRLMLLDVEDTCLLLGLLFSSFGILTACQGETSGMWLLLEVADIVCYSIFCAEDRGFVQNLWRYLIFLVKSRILWKIQPPFLLGPFIPLDWGQRLVLGLRNFTLTFTVIYRMSLSKKRQHFIITHWFNSCLPTMNICLHYHM